MENNKTFLKHDKKCTCNSCVKYAYFEILTLKV